MTECEHTWQFFKVGDQIEDRCIICGIKRSHHEKIEQLTDQLLHKEKIINKQANKLKRQNRKIQELQRKIFKLQEKKSGSYVNKRR